MEAMYSQSRYDPDVRGAPKVQTSVRLSRETLEDMRVISAQLRVSQASVIEMAVAEYARRFLAENPAPKPKRAK